MLRHRRSLPLQSEMNLTNLLDTAFVLLIAFMLMAPMLKNGISLNLPTVKTGPISTQQNTITISIGKAIDALSTDPIYIEEERLTVDQVAETLQKKQATYESISVVIEADKDAKYDTVAQVLGRVKGLGIKSVGLITEPK
ncbi:MAG: biopolymer transporter ExbD [Candidatus Sumerlaeia bacterium]